MGCGTDWAAEVEIASNPPQAAAKETLNCSDEERNFLEFILCEMDVLADEDGVLCGDCSSEGQAVGIQ